MIRFTVKSMLARRNMTQKQLAEITGIRPPTISAICLGTAKHIPVDVLDKLCTALDCQPSDLLSHAKEENA